LFPVDPTLQKADIVLQEKIYHLYTLKFKNSKSGKDGI